MHIFERLHILLADETANRISYKEAYWALRKKYGIKNGRNLDPLPEDMKKKFREEVKKLKNKYNID